MLDPEMIALVTNMGLPVAMVLYFLKRDQVREKEVVAREKRLGTRIDALEDRHRNDLVGVIQETTAVISANAAVSRNLLDSSKRVHASVATLVEVISRSPCVVSASSPQPEYPKRDRRPSENIIVEDINGKQHEVDAEVASIIARNPALARMTTEASSGQRQPVHIDNYDPHPSKAWQVPDPGEPPKTPMPESRGVRKEDAATRRQGER